MTAHLPYTPVRHFRESGNQGVERGETYVPAGPAQP